MTDEQNPGLTVAVLARHRPEYLREMLESIFAAMPAGTIVEVRDHSDDNRCRDLVHELAENPNLAGPLRHMFTQPRGVLANISGAIDECATEFLCILNDDDLSEAPLFHELLPALAKDPTSAFATGVYVCIDGEGRVLPTMRPPAFTTGYIDLHTMEQRARFHVVERQLRPAMGTIFRIEALRGVRLPLEAITIPDLWIARHLMDTGPRGYVSNSVVFRYRVHADSMSGAMKDLAGYKWSMEQFLEDPALSTVASDLKESLRVFERSALLGQYVTSDRSAETVNRIVALSAPSSTAERLAVRLAFTPPLSSLTRAYLRRRNPRLRRSPASTQPQK
jgi:Glycosyltransferase like family 2